MNLLIALLLTCSTLSLSSQTREVIHLWPGDVPGEKDAKHPAVRKDDVKRNIIRLSDVTDPAMVVFRPDSGQSNGTGIIVCPGGAYNILAINLEGYEVAEWLTSLGYTAFVLQYRVPDKKAGALMDAQRAIGIVRANADKWDLDTDRIGIMGFSAGGSLSARLSTLYVNRTYEEVDSSDSFSCRPDFAALIYPAYLDEGNNRRLTPELKVNDRTPPMFIFATADDRYANSALVMAGALRDADVPVELHLLPEGGHGYGLRSGNDAAETWPVLMAKWLEKTL